MAYDAHEPDLLMERMRALCEPRQPMPTDEGPEAADFSGIRAVIFDVYGTLIISGSGDVGVAAAQNKPASFTDAMRAAFPEAPVLTGEQGARALDIYMAEIEADHDAQRARGADYPEVEIREIWERTFARMRAESLTTIAPDRPQIERFVVEYECRINPTWPMPGSHDLLAVLKHRGIVTGIVSNAQFFTTLLVPALFGKSFDDLGFDPRLMVWSYEHRLAKPSKRFMEAIVAPLKEHHGISPEQTLYVGNDMLNDVWTANAVGIRTALFAGDERSLRLRADREQCRGLKPDCVLTHMGQLREMLP